VKEGEGTMMSVGLRGIHLRISSSAVVEGRSAIESARDWRIKAWVGILVAWSDGRSAGVRTPRRRRRRRRCADNASTRREREKMEW